MNRTIELNPSAVYTVQNLSNLHHETSQHSERYFYYDLNRNHFRFSSLCEPWRFIRPNETTTYMFDLKPRNDISFEQFHSTLTLGKLDIAWISGFGERGRLQTNQLPKSVRKNGIA